MVASTADPALDGVAGRAIRDVFPLYLPTVPFALVLGVAMTESAMPTNIAWSTNIVFAGAAQLAMVTLAGTRHLADARDDGCGDQPASRDVQRGDGASLPRPADDGSAGSVRSC